MSIDMRHIYKCDRCGKYVKTRKYEYRVYFDTVQTDDDYRTFGRIGCQLCFKCNAEVQRFIFGNEDETEEVDPLEVENK